MVYHDLITYDLFMIYLWFTYDLPMVYLWFPYDLSMVYPDFIT